MYADFAYQHSSFISEALMYFTKDRNLSRENSDLGNNSSEFIKRLTYRFNGKLIFYSGT